MIRYEWTIETIDEYGDIIDITHRDTYSKIKCDVAAMSEQKFEICLIRDQINDIDEDIEDRQWAYLVNGQLPERFDGGAIIPKRFRAEVQT